MKRKKIALAYSGGLDTSIIIPWLIQNYGCEVVAYIADVGQGDDLAAVKAKALKTGASKAIVADLKREFVENYCFRALRAQTKYEGTYLLGTSLARPVIAKGLVEAAVREGCEAIAHGATGKGNDQVRFELAAMALAPHLKIIAPWREWTIRSRQDAIDFAKSHGIPIPVTKKHPYSMDGNLWHLSHEGGDLENPWNEAGEHVYLITADPLKAPRKPRYLVIGFERGKPVSLDGKKMDGVELLGKLNAIGKHYGVGRINIVENRLVGMKCRSVYESPGATILYEAHRAMQVLTVERDALHYAQTLSLKYADLVYYGQWFSPLRRAIDAFFDEHQQNVTGEARVRLTPGVVQTVGVRSRYSLYSADLATFERDEVYNQKDAEGFIRLFGLPLKVAGAVNGHARRPTA
ncbi:MAG: argininosuccinate synthase [Deltaproteobacteria bacterium]|nr:argininosuccinate synthase [Deltaproteobacteria bacterium]